MSQILWKKADFDAEFTENDNKIPIVLNSLIKKTNFDLKITEIEKRIPNIANFLKRLILILQWLWNRF